MLPGMNTSLPNTQSNADGTLYDHIDGFELWFSTNWPWLWKGAVAIVVITAVLVGYSIVSSFSDAKAAEAFAQVSSNKKLSHDEQISAFAKLISENPNAKASVIARFDVATDFIKKGDFAKANELYQAVIDGKKTPDVMKLRALVNQAYLLELQGKMSESLNALRTILIEQKDINAQFRVEITYAIARLLTVSGDRAGALETLETLIDSQSGYAADVQASPYAFLIRREVQMLKAQQALNMGANLQNIGADLSKIGVQPVSPDTATTR